MENGINCLSAIIAADGDTLETEDTQLIPRTASPICTIGTEGAAQGGTKQSYGLYNRGSVICFVCLTEERLVRAL